MKKLLLLAASLCGLCVLSQGPSLAADQPAVISHVKVVSDKVEDVSSLEAIEKSIFKAGMSDAEKAKAMWETVVKFRHHDVPYPQEFLTNSPAVCDAVKLFNVYGYCSGLAAQPAFLQLARHAGYKARHWSIFRFGEPEIFYGNAWHMYDPGMISYFPKENGEVASVEELIAAVRAWHEKNPGYHDNGNKLKAYMKDPGMKAGPALIANCPTLNPNGSYTFYYFGWYSAMVIFDTDKPFLYEEPYSEGYQVNNQLRRGEKLTFNWSNKGLHVGMLDNPDKKPECLTAKAGEKVLYYTPKLGDLGNERIGNGTLEYNPPLDSLKDVALTYDNLAIKDNALQAVDPAKPATLILDMPCSYVYLTGTVVVLEGTSVTPGGARSGTVAMQISDNNGLDWKDLPAGTSDIQKFVFRRYNYRLKVTLNGSASILSIKLTHDIQHSQRALPAMDKGDNTISFTAGPNEGTLSIEAAPEKHKDKQLTSKSFHVALNNMTENETGAFTPSSDKDATVTYPLETPGAITRIRFGSMYRAQNKNEAWLYQVSFDNGKTFTTVHTTSEHDRSDFSWITVAGDKIPANSKSALVRFQAQGGNSMVLFHPRIDADYQQPNTAPNAFAPINITYTWTENGEDKKDQHTAKTASETWKINCPAKPTLKSMILERP